MGCSSEGPSGGVSMRSPTQTNVSWPYRELHRRPQWRCSYASPPLSTALRSPIGTPPEISVAVFACVPPT
eukprot:1275739-Pyramimonas_sp.AAC.1